MQIVAIANQKGGVGKTTTAHNLAAALAAGHDKRVLLIDADHQMNLTRACGVVEPSVSLMDVLRGAAGWNAAKVDVTPTDNAGEGCVSLIPASRQLVAFGEVFAGEHGREMILKEKMQGCFTGEWDIALIDTAPSLDLVTINAFVAATDVLVPVQCQVMALQGLETLISDISRITRRLNPDIQIVGILPTLFDKRKKLCKAVLQRMRELNGDKVYETVIRESVTLAEAPSFGVSIFGYDAGGNGAQDYRAFAQEFFNKTFHQMEAGHHG
jgi:chromosome partitioning protein